jgi:hypothetical protein
VRLKFRAWAWPLVLVGLLGPSVYGLWFVGRNWRDKELLHREGRQVEGLVVAGSVVGGYDWQTTYHLSYRFAVDGVSYSGTGAARDSTDYVMKRGLFRRQPVTYLPSDPTVNALGEVSADDVRGQRIVTLVLGVPFLLFSLLLGYALFATLRAVAREIPLARRGLVAAGSITGTGSETREDAHIFWLEYQFEAEAGERRGGKVEVAPAVHAQFPAGSRVPVLYDARDPTVHALYPALKWVRVPQSRHTGASG